jgi:hypothetical protein
MDQDPQIENEQDLTKRVESTKDSELEIGLDKLERPAKGDFVAGLKNFIDWVKDLVARK